MITKSLDATALSLVHKAKVRVNGIQVKRPQIKFTLLPGKILIWPLVMLQIGLYSFVKSSRYKLQEIFSIVDTVFDVSIVDTVSVVRRQPDLSRILDFRNVSDSCDVLSAAAEPHVTVVGGVNEPAADAHVHAAQDHDSTRNCCKEDELEETWIVILE